MRIITILLTTLLSFTLIDANLNIITKQYNNDTTQYDLKENYHIGETVYIPSKSIFYQNKDYETDIIVTTPNKLSTITNRIYIDQLGVYKIEYRAKTNTKEIINEVCYFESYDDLYKFSGNKSSLTYGNENFGYEIDKKGLNISLAKDEQFYYNEAINLNELAKNESFIDLMLVPSQGPGSRDFGKFNIRLTDVHNSQNYITIAGQSVENDGSGDPWWCNTTYISAGAYNQSLTGIEWGNPTRIHSGNNFGYPCNFSMYGNRNFSSSIGKELFSLRYDSQEKRIYYGDCQNDDYVIDLDNKLYFSNLYEGFTTGEVYLSIFGDKYFNESANMIVTKIGQSDLSKSVLKDDKKPVILIDSGDFNIKCMPHGLINKKYPVLPAFASDTCCANLPVTTKVFYNYTSSNRYELSIIDNYFYPKKDGKYTIEYSTEDYSGNKTILTYEVEVIDGQDLYAHLNNGTTTIKVGEIASIKKIEYGGGIGDIEVDCFYDFKGETFSLEGNQFRPMEIGNYTIHYIIKDMINEMIELNYTLSVIENKNPVFLQNAELPRFFISNTTYKIPQLIAHDFYNSADVESIIEITSQYRTLKISDTITFNQLDGNKITINYIAEANGLKSNKSYEIPLKHLSNTFNVIDFFELENLKAQVLSNSLSFCKASSDLASFEYIIPLNSEQLQISFSLNLSHKEELELNFKGYDNISNLSINLKLNELTDSIDILVNGFSFPVDIDNNTIININYFNSTKKLTIGNKILELINFSGFDNRGVYLRGLFSGTSNDSSFNLISLSNQKMFVTKDINGPEYILPNYHYINSLDTVFRLDKLTTFDTFSINNKAKVSVTSPSNTKVISSDGVTLTNVDAFKDYTFLLDELGIYNISYEIKDSYGNISQTSFSIKVIDSIAPEITLLSTNKSEAKLNEIVDIALAEASDNIEVNIQVNTYIISPRNVIYSLTRIRLSFDSRKIILNEVGKWTIRYVAIDSYGNVSTLDNYIEVK